MDFGDIMEEWERVSNRKGGRASGGAKAASPKRGAAPEGAAPARRLQELWLERYGVDPAIAEADETERARPLSRKEIDLLPVDATLDLHGMTGTEAESALAAFFHDARTRRCSKVLIVHGKGLHSKGEAVLGRLVARWLERRPEAGRHGHPDRSQGGNGATWVLLKGADQRSR
jgi:DNA-nicking Smr family endonuclease